MPGGGALRSWYVVEIEATFFFEVCLCASIWRFEHCEILVVKKQQSGFKRLKKDPNNMFVVYNQR